MNGTQQQLLTLSAARQQVGVSRATLWRWINERGLRVVKVGGVTRIRQSDLDAFVKRHESETGSVELSQACSAESP